MRFYDPSSTPPERVDSETLFPKCSVEEGTKRCLKLGLLPSVTSVLAVIRQEYLEKWKMSEAIKNFTRHGNSYLAVEEHYKKDSRESQFGTRVHDTIHQFVSHQKPDDQEALKYAMPLIQWLKANECETLLTEHTLACQTTGAAGTIDLVLRKKTGEKILGDIKVVKTTHKKKKVPPLNYRCQLSAYGHMLQQIEPEPLERMSFYLASPYGEANQPKLTLFRYREDYFPEFQACLTLWHAQYGTKNEIPEEENNTHELATFNPFHHRNKS